MTLTLLVERLWQLCRTPDVWITLEVGSRC